MRIACVQLCTGLDIASNLAQASDMIRGAHSQGAHFIATPENTPILCQDIHALRAHAHFEGDQEAQHQSKALDFFSQLAAELKIHLLIGSMGVKVENTPHSLLYNRSYLINPQGKVNAHYDKMHLFDAQITATDSWHESANYQRGTHPVLTKVGTFTLGMSICYDIRFAALYRYYGQRNAHIITAPAAFTCPTGSAHWEVLLRARAIETHAYICAPAQAGYHEDGRKTWGHSMIISPWGEVLAHIEEQVPGFCCADVCLSTLQKARRKIPAWRLTHPFFSQPND